MLGLIFVSGQADVTAPVLSLPTATATGPTTATGTVTTNEGNGTLYFWFTENASETAANIKTNGESQAVTATGLQNVSISGLSQATTYYAHYVHDDSSSNESNVESSTSITTDAGVGGTPYIKKARRKREIHEEVREASRQALLRRRERERLEEQVNRIIEKNVPGKILEYDAQAIRIARIRNDMDRAIATEFELKDREQKRQKDREQKRQKRRKRDKLAVMLLLH